VLVINPPSDCSEALGTGIAVALAQSADSAHKAQSLCFESLSVSAVWADEFHLVRKQLATELLDLIQFAVLGLLGLLCLFLKLLDVAVAACTAVA
jgi:hypothetical protein